MNDRLVMSGIAKSFGATRALECVDLAVGAGQSLALIGENGAGKSTLMKILTGAIRPDGGSMLLEGAPFAPQGPLDARTHGVTIVHQELAIAAELTVAENVLLGSFPARLGVIDRARQRELARAALDQLGCAELVDVRRAGDLPIAQQQLVEIARAIAAGPRLLVLDEPTSSLTAEDVQRLFTALRRLKAGGVSLIYISHFLEECRAIADRFAVHPRRPHHRHRRDGRGQRGADHHRHGRARDGRHLPAHAARHRRAAAGGARPAGPAQAARRRPDAAPGRGARPVRPGRRRAQRDPARAVRARPGRRRRGPPARAAAAAHHAAPPPGGGHGPAQREPQGGGPAARALDRRQPDPDQAEALRARRPDQRAPPARRRDHLDGEARRQGPRPRAGDRRAERRQPAEGRDRAPAPPRHRPAAARRADARHRRRRQGPGLPPDRRARRHRRRRSWSRAATCPN